MWFPQMYLSAAFEVGIRMVIRMHCRQQHRLLYGTLKSRSEGVVRFSEAQGASMIRSLANLEYAVARSQILQPEQTESYGCSMEGSVALPCCFSVFHAAVGQGR